jgi:hypothetical protein
MKPDQARTDAVREGAQIHPLSRLESRNVQTASRPKPPWLGARRGDLHAVCEEAGGPNISLEALIPDFDTKPALLREVLRHRRRAISSTMPICPSGQTGAGSVPCILHGKGPRGTVSVDFLNALEPWLPRLLVTKSVRRGAPVILDFGASTGHNTAELDAAASGSPNRGQT